MPQVLVSFDPTTPPAANTSSFVIGQNTGTFVAHNESNTNIELTWPGNNAYCPAWQSTIFCFQTPNATINWSVLSTLTQVGLPPISNLTIEYYKPGEPIPGTYPAPLLRQVNLGGGSVNSNVTSTNKIVNDGNPANTQIIESTVLGDIAPAVTLTNDAQMVLGNTAHPGKLTIAEIDGTPILQLFALDFGDADLSAKNGDVNLQCLQDTGNPALASRVFMRINHFWNGTNDIFVSANPAYQWACNLTLGMLSFRQNSNAPSIGGIITWTATIWSIDIAGNISIPNSAGYKSMDALGTVHTLLTEDSSNQVKLGAGGANNILFLDNAGNVLATLDGSALRVNTITTQSGSVLQLQEGGVNVLQITSTGPNLNANMRYNCLAGSISRFTGFSGTGSGTVNTNLGATPNQITFNPCTVSGSSQTIGGTTAQSSVVTTGAGLAWGGHAWKDVG